MRLRIYFFILLFYFTALRSNAQLCNGTLGDAIFKETFGAGTTTGNALPPGTTTYTYTNGWPTDGQYTISNTSNPPPENAHWHKSADHTGDPDGYMFVVNASYAPGEFYRYKVTDLCANTTYVFSAWIANVNDTNTVSFCEQNDPPYVFPNVLFKVEIPGTSQIDSISTGPIPPSGSTIVWKQFGFTFSTGAGQTSVDLVMVNNGNGGCGNDLVIDDISFRPCGPTSSVTAQPSKPFYCDGDSLVLDATIGVGYNNPVYQWQFSDDGGASWQNIPGATSQDLVLNPIEYAQAGKYRLIVAENGNINFSKCRIVTEDVTIKVTKGPAVTVTASPVSVCKGASSVLKASGAVTYSWFNNSHNDTIHVKPLSTTTYTVTGTDTATGCKSKATVTVSINPPPDSPLVTEPDSICPGNTATIKATSPGGGTYKWYETATGGTVIYAGDTYQTPVLTSTTTYYVEVESTVFCISAVRTPVTVTVMKPPVSPVVTGTDTICAGDTATLKAVSPGGTYHWYETATGGSPVHTGDTYHTPVLTSNKTYYVEVVSKDLCSSTTRTPVTVHMSQIKAQFTATPPVGPSPLIVNFINLSTGGVTYHWDLGNQYTSTSKNTIYTYTNDSQESSTYEITLIAWNALGCADTAKLIVVVDPLSELIVPNVFTPNGDGINDLFTLKSNALKFINATLFDRWGLKLYEWSTIRGGWDGRTEAGVEVPQGTYYYIITALGVDGKEYKLQGPFTLLR